MKGMISTYSAIISLLLVHSAWADQKIIIASSEPSTTLNTNIASNAFQNSKGLIGINASTGNLNLQSNQRALSLVPNGISSASNEATQILGSFEIMTPPCNSQSYIGAQAFSNISGIFSINQASGIANMQANQAVLNFGPSKLSIATDNVLANSVSPTSVTTTDGSGNTGNSNVGIDGTAFSGASGIVQLNQAAGIANTTANQFSLGIRF
jgi:hypothetical protein